MKVLIFSLTNLSTQQLVEYSLYQKLKDIGFNVEIGVFSFDKRLKTTTTDSIVYPRSFTTFKKDCIRFSANKFNLFNNKRLSNYLKDVSHVMTRQIGKNSDLLLLQAIAQQSHNIKHIVYVMNTVGAEIGLSGKNPDYYLCPGIFWEQLLKEKKSFLTGLKKYDFPFLTKSRNDFNGKIVRSGLLSWLEVENSKQNVSKETFHSAYNINNKFIIYCLESTTKYIDEKCNPKGSMLPWTIEMIKQLKDLLGSGYDILIKGHPFQYQKPYPWYKRKQLPLEIFEEYGKILRPDDGYHAFRFADFAVVGNSSVAYEAALCGCTCVAIAANEKDFYQQDSIFQGPYYTPEIFGFLFDNFSSFENNLQHVLSYSNDKEKNVYLEQYGNYFDTNVIKQLISK